MASPVANADFYAGASIGKTDLNTDAETKEFIEETGVNADFDDTGYKFFAGYRVNDFIAVEVAYNDLGEATMNQTIEHRRHTHQFDASASADSVGVSLVGL